MFLAVSVTSISIPLLLGYLCSSRHPDELYKNGIQRSSFVPCIDLIKKRFDVVDLDSGTDYRRIPRALSKTYFSPLNDETRAEMRKSFEGLTNPSPSINESKKEESDPVVMDRKLSLWGRKLNVPESTKDVARFSFHDLCAKPLSSADYLEITRTFGTIFVEDVARMGLNEKDMARRFITFIDGEFLLLLQGLVRRVERKIAFVILMQQTLVQSLQLATKAK